jgi:adenylylsulfate kinase
LHFFNSKIKVLKNIFPVFDQIVSQEEKEKFLGQRAIVLWFTGLSGSGKTTMARLLEKRLHENKFLTKLLDGDNVRSGLNNNLGFKDIDRKENIRRVAEVSKLFLECGIITLCSFISPKREMRKLARTIIGTEHFLEVHIDCSMEICEARDPKGLYKKVRSGQIKDFTGIHNEYEVPENPDYYIKTDEEDLQESLNRLYDFLLQRITFK